MLTQFHSQDENIIVNNVQDVQPTLERCKALSEIQQGKEMKLAASFPMVVVEKYIADKGITFEEFTRDKTHVRNMMNDSALKGFRVWQGRV